MSNEVVDEIAEVCKTSQGRKWFIRKYLSNDKWLSEHGEDNWQKVPTPYKVINKMLSLIKYIKGKKILVLFNLEFIEQLKTLYDVDMKNIYFIADTPAERQFADKYLGVNATMIKAKNVGGVKGAIEDLENSKFDVLLSNPPYNRNIDIKILSAVLPYADEAVIVHPSTWLLDVKGTHKLYNTFREGYKDKLNYAFLFNGNPVFGIQLFLPCVISHFKEDNNGSIDVEAPDYLGGNYTTDNIYDITKFGSSWEGLIKSFYEKMVEYCEENGSIWDDHLEWTKIEEEYSEDDYYVQFADIRGTPYRGNNTGVTMVLEDFYTLCMKDPETNKGVRLKTKSTKCIWKFSTKFEQENFIKYTCTKFARFCLMIIKNDGHSNNGNTKLIPKLDWSITWTDVMLFEKFDVSEELQEFINEYIPTWHKEF